MDTKIVILGESNEIKNLSFIKAYVNISKIIITSNFLLKNFNEREIISIFSKNPININEEDKSKINQSKFNNELYEKIQDNLKEISSVHLDVNIQNLNFVSALSGGRFNIRLRTESFTITDYFIEKGEILGKIKKLLIEYLDFKGNFLRKESLSNFQIEIFESDDIYKSIILKKYEDSFILASSFGFSKTNFIIDSLNSPEIYISKGRDYKLFKSKQLQYYKREHSKIIESSINVNKVLTNEDLKLIYEKTRNIKDLIIEMYITEKGKLKIIDIDISYEKIDKASPDGFYIYKNNFDINKISLIGLQDDLETEYPYPVYLLIKNNLEIEEFFNNIPNYLNEKYLPHFDGIVFTENIFSQYLTKIGDEFNIDVIYFNKELNKSNTVEITKPLNFSSIQQNNDTSDIKNLFKTEEEDKLLTKLKNINLELNQDTTSTNLNNNFKNENLDTNNNNNNQKSSKIDNQNNLHNFAQNFLYHKNKKKEEEYQEEGEKMGAINFFTKKALETQNSLKGEKSGLNNNNNNLDNKNNNTLQKEQNNSINLSNQHENLISPEENYNNETKTNTLTQLNNIFTGNNQQNQDNTINNNYNNNNSLENNYNTHINKLTKKEEIIKKELELEKNKLNRILQELNNSFSEIKKNNELVGKFRETLDENLNLNTINKNNFLNDNNNKNINNNNNIKEEVLNKFENILSISLIGISEFGELVDKLFVSEYNNYNKESFMLVSSKEEIKEEYNINYILPFSEDINEEDKYYYLINNTEAFFHLNGHSKGYFVNTNNLNKKTINKFIENLYKKNKNLYIIIKKEELELLNKIINYIKGVYITDLNNEEEINNIKNKLLKYEKEQLITILNKFL